MARFGKIYAGPVSENLPQVQEGVANADTKPGLIVVFNAGKYDIAGAAATGALRVAQDNYLAGEGPDVVIKAGDTIIGMEMLDEQFFNVIVPTGQNIVKGDALSLGAGGKLVKGAGRVVAFAEETYNNATGADQLVRVRVANNAVAGA